MITKLRNLPSRLGVFNCITLLLFMITTVAFVIAKNFHTDSKALVALCFLAIGSQAGMFCIGTELISSVFGEHIGALANVVFGNFPEAIFIYTLFKGDEARLIASSMAGSVVSNVLLLLSLSTIALYLATKTEASRNRNGAVIISDTVSAHERISGDEAIAVREDPSRVRSSPVLAIVAFQSASSFTIITMSPIQNMTISVIAVTSLLGIGLTLFLLSICSTRFRSWMTLTGTGTEQDPARSTRTTLVYGALVMLTATSAAYFVQQALVDALKQTIGGGTGHSNGTGEAYIFGLLGNGAEHISAILLAWKGKREASLQIPLQSSLNMLTIIIPLAWAVGLAKDVEVSYWTKVEIPVLFLSAYWPLHLLMRRGRVPIAAMGVVFYITLLATTFTGVLQPGVWL